MTDRVCGLTVCLGKDVRIDDVQELIKAIEMMKGVAVVNPLISDHTQWIADERAKREYREKLWEVLK